jgi:putative ABC transport system ATP-binding protein
MGVSIELTGVTKTFPSPDAERVVAVDGVDLSIDAGEAVGIMGPSGSGKSTLLHLIGAMDAPSEGRIHVGDRELTALSRGQRATYRGTIGFVFQRFHLLAALNVLDNVVAPVLPYRTSFDKWARAHELLESVGLSGKESRLPSRLSGGEQQRVAIARALINDPGLLLADEPTGNLDSGTSTEIVQLMLDLRAERGMTLLVATHDPIVATRCDRIVRIQDGRVVEDLDVRRDQESEDVLDRIAGLDPGN